MEDPGNPRGVISAHELGLTGCPRCGKVHADRPDSCARCGAPLVDWTRRGTQVTWAWLLAGLILYIPANLYPMLRTTMLGQTSEATILGGVVDLLKHGDVWVAVVVFVASIAIPIAKFATIAVLCLSVSGHVALPTHGRQLVLEWVDFIGRWSMIDVFVVAILASLVQLSFAATIKPGIAAVSFALSVVFTMISAQSFDSRLIWNGVERRRQEGQI